MTSSDTFDADAVPVRPAATIMLLDDRPDLYVLMVRRTARVVFAAAMWVFPGRPRRPRSIMAIASLRFGFR